ncbi:hypothetical protein [Streptomyces sp. 840.1]|uniref:hypothetical protein n=1 Tax=Streptomyces sp. 840.1 TaxID=2485152 RepID=UPI000F48B0C1|nr:hypothetical protein [Streptomyces sp. 840.1]
MRVVVEPVTKDIADEAIRLLRATGLHGHKYAVDAALAVIAGRQPGRGPDVRRPRRLPLRAAAAVPPPRRSGL